MHDYSLVLCPIHHDLYDMSGTKFPDKGFVKCENFSEDNNIDSGLFGINWGIDNGYEIASNFVDGKWAVIRMDSRFITIDSFTNAIKFEQGYVILIGDKIECMKVIQSDAAYPKKSPKQRLSFLYRVL